VTERPVTFQYNFGRSEISVDLKYRSLRRKSGKLCYRLESLRKQKLTQNRFQEPPIWIWATKYHSERQQVEFSTLYLLCIYICIFLKNEVNIFRSNFRCISTTIRRVCSPKALVPGLQGDKYSFPRVMVNTAGKFRKMMLLNRIWMHLSFLLR